MLVSIQKQLQKRKAAIDRVHTKKSQQRQVQHVQSLMDSNQKLGNKMATGKHKPNPAVAGKAVLTPDGTLHTAWENVVAATAEWGKKKVTAPEANGKTGKYLPDEVDRQYV
eukprot:GHRQ01006901.1.p3 GENE.GHRQ01006901.1~~GHRQ01006901.1.p3  ORF type:complete len:111 (-),score=16.33 GHRQ01006901.1:904-1236(-)